MRTPSTRTRLLVVAGMAASLLLLVVGLSAGWALVLLLLTAGSLVLLGFTMATDRLYADQARLHIDRQTLDAEWAALDRTRRIRSVFLQARRAMRAEAGELPTPQPDEGEQR